MKKCDVLVIGANTSGLIASMLCGIKGLDVLCVDKNDKIEPGGVENLSPSCMDVLEELDMLEALEDMDAQYKNGLAFAYNGKYKYFNFFDKSYKGYGSSYQMPKSNFYKVLLKDIHKKGVEVRYKTSVENVDFKKSDVLVHLNDKKGDVSIKAKFILDASGEVLPRLKKLTKHISFSKTKAYHTTLKLKNTHPFYDNKKIFISAHPKKQSIWFWLTPPQNSVSSLGVVGVSDDLRVKGLNKNENRKILKHLLNETIILKDFLKNSSLEKDINQRDIHFKIPTKLCGDRFALLANADELLNPIFCTGTCLSFYSAKLASLAVIKILKNKKCDLQDEYEEPFMHALETFKTYVDGWQSGFLKDVIFAKNPDEEIEKMISSILAGYIYDRKNPYVNKSKSRLKTLANSSKS